MKKNKSKKKRKIEDGIMLKRVVKPQENTGPFTRIPGPSEGPGPMRKKKKEKKENKMLWLKPKGP